MDCRSGEVVREEDPTRIRFGIMCNGTTLLQWQGMCLESLLNLPNVTLELLIIDEDFSSSQSILGQLKRLNWRQVLYQLYMRSFCRPKTRSRVDWSERLRDVPQIRCKVIRRSKFSQYFSESDVKRIRECNLDFVLRFGFGIIRGEILEAPRYGVWSYHCDDELKYRGGPPLFWEIYHNDPISGTVLQRLTDRLDGGIILKKGFFSTVRHSYAKNIDQVYVEAGKWVSQVCVDIRNGVAGYLEAASSKTTAPVYHAPGNLQMILFVLKTVVHRIRLLCRAIFRKEQWNIGVIRAPVHSLLKRSAPPSVHWLPAPESGAFLADPFGIRKNGKDYVFFEHYDYRESRGRIRAGQLTADERLSEIIEGVRSPNHLAYPFLLEHEGDVYCVPDTSRSGEVAIYKAESFPGEWTKAAVLIDNVGATDPTVFRYERRWWLMHGEPGSGLNLFVWYSDSLFGPWTPHAVQPAKTDVRSARPGGTPFVHDGVLYRPAQDCSSVYGGRVVINRVLKLTPTEFKEEPIAFITPDKGGPYPHGLHSLCSVGDITLVDGKREEFILHAVLSHLKERIRQAYRRKMT